MPTKSPLAARAHGFERQWARQPRALIFRGCPDGSFTILDDEFAVSIGGHEAGFLGFNAVADIFVQNEACVAAISSLEFGGAARTFGMGHVIPVDRADITAVMAALVDGNETLAFELLLARRMAAALEDTALDERACEELYGV